jgi:sigma-B regulation protein RsbU (phosphoserine phosphatase)
MAQILVVDDDAAARLVLKRALESHGHQVSVATNGAEGLQKAQELKPALMICDWVMPIVDGLELCRQVKTNPDLSTTFFVLLTSRTSLEDRILGLDTGADDFLSKPIELTELQARVRAGLRVYHLTRDLQSQKQLLESELAEASEYVRSLLPGPMHETVTIEASFIPSRKLGGDCYDYYWLDEDHLLMFLLDMAGHGLGAALPSVSILNLLRSQSLTEVNFHEPTQVLMALNRIFQMSKHGDKYFTIWYGVFNIAMRQIHYASAGHPPAILISGDPTHLKLEKLKTKGFPIGMFSDNQYVSQKQTIEPGSSLYIFSDGVYELPQPNGQVWGLPNFIDLLQALHHEGDIDLKQVLKTLQGINGQDAFQDDVSLIKINF